TKLCFRWRFETEFRETVPKQSLGTREVGIHIMDSTQLITAQQHILEEQRRHHPQATGEFSWLLSGITLAGKIISANVRRCLLADGLGSPGQEKVEGATVQKPDRVA